MQAGEMLELLGTAPVIAAIKDEQGLQRCLASDVKVVFTLYGTLMELPRIAKTLRQAGRAVIVHMDLVDGLAPRESAVEYIAKATVAHGIISTKPALVASAKAKGLLAVRRFFLLDSMAMHSMEKQLAPDTAADFVEVLPGTMPKTLQRVVARTPVPIIAGGLIADKEDVVNALSAGAVAVSTTNAGVWGL